jgi:hypothetical protein
MMMGYGKRMLDYAVCLDGRFYGFEAKRKGARAQGFQHKLVREIREAGGVSFIFDDFQNFIENMGIQ